jgi:hypothetical protein
VAPSPDAAPRPDAAPSIRDMAGGPLVGGGTLEGHDHVFGPSCTRGTEEAPPTLPFPVAIPVETYMAWWCRDGDSFFYDKGMKAAEGKLVGGRPDGAWTYYHESGERLLSGRYINGDAEGLWRAYDPDGTVTQLGCFRAGKKRWGVTGDKAADGC